MQDPALPGRTDWETHEYLRDRGHRVAAAQAYRYLGSRIETDDSYPLPDGADAVIAEAATVMQAVTAARLASAQAYADAIKDIARETNAAIVTGNAA